jgi:hypothetical protein
MDNPNDSMSQGWITLAGNALIGGTTALKNFLSYISSEFTEQRDPFPFTDLPQDIQNTIISLVMSNNNAKSLKGSAQTINTVSQVNHQLNNLINEPQFCLQIIEHLSNKFDCSNQVAAMALQTRQAKQRLNIQMQLAGLLTTKKTFDHTEFEHFYKTYKDYIDLNFTYGNTAQNEDFKMTPLMLSSYAKDSAMRIKSLLNTKAVDINRTNKSGMTALMLCAIYSRQPEALELLCQDPATNLNQQDLYGNTAIMLLCKYCDRDSNATNIKILLDNSADPEIADSQGTTPLDAAPFCNTDMENNQDIIDLLKNAIKEKYSQQ